MKTIAELKTNIEAIYAKYEGIKAALNESYENDAPRYDLIDALFQLEGVFKRQIINLAKRYFTSCGWSTEEVNNYINYLRREDCGWCWMREYREAFKYA